MSFYETEEEQIEAIKAWWQRNQRWITMIAFAGLVLFAGFRYWQWHTAKVTHGASSAYERLMAATANEDNNSIEAYAKTIIKNYPNTVYSDASKLTLAKYWVSEKEPAKAIEVLESVVTDGHMAALKEVATLRLARIFISEGAYQKAIERLNGMTDTIYLPLVEELKGDAYFKLGEVNEARLAYQKAKELVKLNGLHNGFLDMKLEQIG